MAKTGAHRGVEDFQDEGRAVLGDGREGKVGKRKDLALHVDSNPIQQGFPNCHQARINL